jgi:predicted DNA-binding transcriptional regulator AlpA
MSDTNLLTLTQVLALTGIKTSTWYKHMKRGSAPRPVPVGISNVMWPRESIEQWVASRSNSRFSVDWRGRKAHLGSRTA